MEVLPPCSILFDVLKFLPCYMYKFLCLQFIYPGIPKFFIFSSFKSILEKKVDKSAKTS